MAENRKDPDKWRRQVKKASKRYRERKAIRDFFAETLTLWMRTAMKGLETEVILARIGEKDEVVLPVLNKESFTRQLERYNFPYKVELMSKKFVLKCVEVEE